MRGIKIVSIIAAGIIAASVGSAQANTVVFFDDFSSGSAAAEISGAGSVVGVGGYSGINGFSDNFLHNSAVGVGTVLTLNGLAAHTTMTIEFDLAMIDSWDGTSGAHAPDFFNLIVDGATELVVSVDNGESTATELVPSAATNRIALQQLFGNGLGTDPTCTGYFCDSGFSISLTFAHSSSTSVLNFIANGNGYQGGSDESWAIDNVRVSTNAVSPVPIPAALPLLLVALGGLGLVARRRKAA